MLLPIFIFTVGIVNLAIGSWLLITTQTFSNINVALVSVGSSAFLLLTITCIVRPKSFMECPGFIKRLFVKRHSLKGSKGCINSNSLNPENAEIVIKNLRGIPYLIQAIQYSMETTCSLNTRNKLDGYIFRTAVIHTAPACHSLTEVEEDSTVEETTTRSACLEELWKPIGSSLWNNAQLNLSLSSGDSEFSVFPYSETGSPRKPQNRNQFEFEEIMKGKKPTKLSLRAPKVTTCPKNRQSFQF